MQDSSIHYFTTLHRAVIDYETGLQVHTFTPAVIPWIFLNTLVLGTWLFFTSRRDNRMPLYLRLAVFGLILGLSASALRSRSLGLAYGVGIGLNSAWCCISAVNLILIKNPRDFRRLVLDNGSLPHEILRVPTSAPQGAKFTNGHKKEYANLDERRLIWQSCPEDTRDRLDWVVDLMFTLHATKWSWTAHSNHPPPALHASRMPNLAPNLTYFISSYLLIDLLKLLVITDPYFTGTFSAPPPAYLPAFLRNNAFHLHTYHLLITAASIYMAIHYFTALGALLYMNILSPYLAGIHAEPWMHPAAFGPFSTISARGLTGFWGKFWHQSFRLHFETIGDWVVHILLLDRKTASARYARYITGFVLSGVLHACASATLWGPTRPWAPLLFFALQPAGIALQSLLDALACVTLPGSVSNNTTVQQGIRLLYTILWLRMTFPLLADDFATGGMWMFEPLPVSVVRGLGVGGVGGWWCWWGPFGRWYSGDSVLNSGLAL